MHYHDVGRTASLKAKWLFKSDSAIWNAFTNCDCKFVLKVCFRMKHATA